MLAAIDFNSQLMQPSQKNTNIDSYSDREIEHGPPMSSYRCYFLDHVARIAGEMTIRADDLAMPLTKRL
jgi:hypothetical protein